MNKRTAFVFVWAVCTALTVFSQVSRRSDAQIEERISEVLSRMTTHEKIKMVHAQSKFTSAGVPRLGIRQLNMSDGPHGVRDELAWDSWSMAGWTNDSIVAFPSLTCLAATWNRDLSTLYGHSVSEEFAFRGKDVMLGPGVNIQRTPMNGRAFEYMGEDPVLAGEMVVPYIVAAQKNGVGCCLKHFVLNDQETNRFSVNVNVSERAMREIYLYPFEQAVKRAKVWSIMGSYNQWNNIHCCQNDGLLNGILKKEWGWDGAVVSDWDGTHDTWQAATGGLDIEMGTSHNRSVKGRKFTYDDYYLGSAFEQLIEEGKLPMSVLDEKVRRVLRLIFRTAMNPEKVIGSQCAESHYEACRQIAEEGIVLLKNTASLLPVDFSNYQRILVVGENATRSLTKGGGSSELKTLKDIAPLEALQELAGSKIDYVQGYTSGRAIYDRVDKTSADENVRLKEEAIAKAKEADLIIFIGGLNKNHKQDCENGDREDYNLSFGQNELISELAKVQPRTIVVTYGGNPYAMPWLDSVGALIHCWYLGSESGSALANVLTGKVNPSGKLPVTFAKRLEDYPYAKFGAEAYPGVPATERGKGPQVTYKEDIFVGYRGFENNKTKPQFPFGFGLSYTTFKYEKPVVTLEGDKAIVRVTVSNTGSVAGKETIQLYVSAPKNKTRLNAPKELKNFAKTRLLQPGEYETLEMKIDKQMLSYWDENAHQWAFEPGKYTILFGASSADIRGKETVTFSK